jgi:SPX domain protein involved in polyphosphate accumulation
MSESGDIGYRFERKYHIQEMPTWEVEHWVSRSPALFSEVFAPRHVNNIYLDSPQLEAYFENLQGIADRTKLRIRWYGPLLGPLRKPILEFKIKRGMVGTKEFFPLHPFPLEPGFGIQTLEAVFAQSDLPPSLQLELAAVEPTLINRYHRKYFVSADGLYRITIDSQLAFYRVHRHHNQFLAQTTLPDSTVMELKYAGDIDRIDDRITNFFPFRVTRMSKYVTGVEGVEG